MNIIYKTRVRKTSCVDSPVQVILHYEAGKSEPWVVHSRNMQTGGLYGGHYHDTFESAKKCYIRKCVERGLSPVPVPSLFQSPELECGPNVPIEDDSRCQGCGMILAPGALENVDDLHERVYSGEEMPSGQCPECGALAHPIGSSRTEMTSWDLGLEDIIDSYLG